MAALGTQLVDAPTAGLEQVCTVEGNGLVCSRAKLIAPAAPVDLPLHGVGLEASSMYLYGHSSGPPVASILRLGRARCFKDAARSLHSCFQQVLYRLQEKRVALERVVLQYGEAPAGIKEVFELCRGFERAYTSFINVSSLTLDGAWGN